MSQSTVACWIWKARGCRGRRGPSCAVAAAPTRPIFGTVRDKDTGEPLAGVTVHGRIPSGLGTQSQNEVTTLTDHEGRYRLVGLAKGQVDSIAADPPAGQPYLPVTAPIG